jgi:cell wall-associated NlpC family hydrolase
VLTYAPHRPSPLSAVDDLAVDQQPTAARPSPLARVFAILIAAAAIASLGACTTANTSGRGGQIANFAYSHLGAGYTYGAAGPYTFDCSGLVQYVYRQAGVGIPRTTYEQAGAGYAVPNYAAQPGDVVFLGGASHVGIYVGGGWMIDAPHTGAVVTKRPIYAGYSVRRLY